MGESSSGEDIPGKKTTWGMVGEMWTRLGKLQVIPLGCSDGFIQGRREKLYERSLGPAWKGL